MNLLLLWGVFVSGLILGGWLGYYVGSHREEED